MKADKGFEEKVRRIHPGFVIKWKDNKWTIYQKLDNNQLHFIMRVQEDDGSYRPLDYRTLGELKRIVWLNEHYNSKEIDDMYCEEEMKEEKEEKHKTKEAIGKIVEDSMKEKYKPSDFGFTQVPSGFEGTKGK